MMDILGPNIPPNSHEGISHQKALQYYVMQGYWLLLPAGKKVTGDP